MYDVCISMNKLEVLGICRLKFSLKPKAPKVLKNSLEMQLPLFLVLFEPGQGSADQRQGFTRSCRGLEYTKLPFIECIKQ